MLVEVVSRGLSRKWKLVKWRLMPLLAPYLLMLPLLILAACGQTATPGNTPDPASNPDIEATIRAAVAATVSAASVGPTETPEPPTVISQATGSQSSEEARVQATIAALLATPASPSVSAPPVTPTPTPSPTATAVPTAIWAPTRIPDQPQPTPTTAPPSSTATILPTAILAPTPTATPDAPCQLAPDGVPVTAWIDGSRVALRHVTKGDYSLFIEQREGSIFAGKTATFQIGSDIANESAIWTQGGGDELDLTANTDSASISSIPSDTSRGTKARGSLLAQPLPPHFFLGTVSLCGSP